MFSTMQKEDTAIKQRRMSNKKLEDIYNI